MRLGSDVGVKRPKGTNFKLDRIFMAFEQVTVPLL